MLKKFKSSVVATGLVLATANAAVAANEIDMHCVGPNNSGYGQMKASISPTEYHTVEVMACEYEIYLSPVGYERLQECLYEIGINVPVWYGSHKFCTFTP